VRPSSLPVPSGFLSRFRHDIGGVSAVEFALLAPIMIGMYLGLAEFCQAFIAQKRMGHATAQVADIIAQSNSVTRDDISDVFAIGNLIMEPFPVAPLGIRVSGVTRGADGIARVNWSRSQGPMTALGTNAVVTIPAGMIVNGESVVMSEVTYDYQSTLGNLLPVPTRFRHVFYLRPRLVNAIICTDC